MNTEPPDKAPGPKGLPVFGSLLDIQRDVLGLMIRSREQYGDVARHRAGPVTIYSVQSPEAIEQILKDRTSFNKQTRSTRMIRRLTGDSLLVTDGDQWQTQRKSMQPGFVPPRLRRFAEGMMLAVQPTMESLAKAADENKQIDMALEMMHVTYRIVEKSLFGSESPQEIDNLELAISVVLGDIYRRIEKPFVLPLIAPTARNRMYKQSISFLNERVFKIIQDHRIEPKNTLLSMLMQVKTESGQQFSDEQLRNETITMLIAGHETTACGLMWFWHLIGNHPEIERQIYDELPVAPFQCGTSESEDFTKLETIRLAFNETLRLYPPIWAILRKVTTDSVVQGFRFRKGARIILSPYVVHRHPDHWEDAEGFNPFRTRPNHHYAYIPYGGGPRLCIGHAFAKLEAQIVIAMIMQKFRLRTVEGHKIELDPGITLRSKFGMPMLVERR